MQSVTSDKRPRPTNATVLGQLTAVGAPLATQSRGKGGYDVRARIEAQVTNFAASLFDRLVHQALQSKR
jgi:hypothetical protein